MNVQQMNEMVAQKQFGMLEGAWMEAVEQQLPAADLAPVLDALVKAEQLDTAETLATLLLEMREPLVQPPQMLEVARLAASAIPLSDQLRSKAAELYRKVHGGRGNFDAILKASGLLGGQSPRRAFRTLDTCLAITEGTYLANRYDHHVFVAGKYNDVFGEYEVADAAGKVSRLEPKALADEFDIAHANDFRVLAQHRDADLKAMLDKDPAAVLVGLCQSGGGSINSDTLKDRLVPRYISSGEWAGWWSRARTAAKRSPQLSVEGRNPVTIVYHASGRTLEEELASAVAEARTPQKQLALLQQYVRDAKDRKLPVLESFTGPIMDKLSHSSVSYLASRPSDALLSALAVQAALALGIAPPKEAAPTPAQLMTKIQKPAAAIAGIDNADLWPPALDALAQRPDAADQLVALLDSTPATLLDEVAGRLHAAGRTGAIEEAAAQAYADPLGSLEFTLWLWKGPLQPPANASGKVELFSRVLKALADLEHEWDARPAHRKAVFQRFRSAFSAQDYAAYRLAISQMNEAVAETIKRQVERAEGPLAESVQDTMLAILKENFYNLFAIKERVPPWLDENSIYTTEESLHAREKELKELNEVRMVENARAIGAAAEHGDLSENADWKSALEEREILGARSGKLTDEINKARVLHPGDVSMDVVCIGSRVTLKRMSDGEEIALCFLGPWDADISRRIYNYQTPIARELMGKAIGDTVEMELEGKAGQYVIERLGNALKK